MRHPAPSKTRCGSSSATFLSFESTASFVVSQGIGYVPVPGVGEGFSAVTGLLGDPADLSPRAASLLLLTRDKDNQTDAFLREALKR